MGSEALPAVSVAELVTRWQFAPVVTGFVVAAAGLYLWGVLRMRRRHPARPWPPWRTAVFLGGLGVVVIAAESGVGSYDDVLFWDHMVQHLLVLMVAPPLLVLGQPATLLLHASRNPVHTWANQLLRSRVVSWITWPPFGVALYVGVIVGTHLTSFMNLVLASENVHNAEPALYLAAGYLYFLPLLGREPIRWIGLLPVPDPPALPGHAGRCLHRPGCRRRKRQPVSRPGPGPPGLGAESAERRAHRRRGDVGRRGGPDIRHHDDGVLRLDPRGAQRRRARLAGDRAPGELSPRWPARTRRPASPATGRAGRPRPATPGASTTMSTWPPTTPTSPGSTSSTTAEPAAADRSGSAATRPTRARLPSA